MSRQSAARSDSFPVSALVGSAGGLDAISQILGHLPKTFAASVGPFCGATVFATDQASSDQYSMPLAAIKRDDAVDRILPLDEIAEALQKLVAAHTVTRGRPRHAAALASA